MSVSIVPAARVQPVSLSGLSEELRAFVPRDDRARYSELPEAAKIDLRAKLTHLGPLIVEGKKPRHLSARLTVAARKLGISYSQCRRLWDAWWTHQWQGLVNRALAGPRWQERRAAAAQQGGIFHRPGFLQFVRATFEANQRGSRAAYKFVLLPRLAKWRATQDPRFAIPGYDAPPANAEGFNHPLGWSYDNLMQHSGSRFELKAARIGLSYAADERPLVYTTRAGLWVGSHYQIDDMWHDHFVNTLAEGKHGRPMELFSHDLFSARKVRWGVRVRVKDDAGKYAGLEERMTRLILAATLYLDGYSPRGTVIIAEHGTAAVRADVETALCELTDGLVTVQRSGMKGAKAHDGQYGGISRGNFRFKASLESSNNLTHNVFAGLPGQTGKDVAHRPEELGALLTYNANLLRAYPRLSPDRQALLEFPLLELGQFHSVAHELYGLIESDPDHDLEGWAACGHFVQQIWADGDWRDLPPLDTLPPETAAALTAALDAGDVRSRPRKMTRREVWDRGAGDLIKLPGHGVWEILREDLAVERTVLGNELAFEDAEAGPGKHRFSTRGLDAYGAPVDLADRSAYRVIINPFAPETVFVGDLSGRYIGEFRALVRPTRGTVADDPAILAAIGAAAHRRTELLGPLRERHAPAAAAKAASERRNLALLDTARPATPAERATAKQQRAEAYDANDFAAPTPEPHHPAPPTQETPAVETGEGFWSEADCTATDSPPRQTPIYDAEDFF